MAILIESRVQRRGGGIFRVHGRFADDAGNVKVQHEADYDKNGAQTPAQFKAAFKADVQTKLDAALLAYNTQDEQDARTLQSTVETHLQEIASELT